MSPLSCPLICQRHFLNNTKKYMFYASLTELVTVGPDGLDISQVLFHVILWTERKSRSIKKNKGINVQPSRPTKLSQ